MAPEELVELLTECGGILIVGVTFSIPPTMEDLEMLVLGQSARFQVRCLRFRKHYTSFKALTVDFSLVCLPCTEYVMMTTALEGHAWNVFMMFR